MNWLQRAYVQQVGELTRQPTDPLAPEEQMRPGFGKGYNAKLRENAGTHMPPPPPEFMGINGEYDPSGLAKRAAIALDDDPVAANLNQLRLIQSGDAVIFEGQVPSQIELEHVVDVVKQVDGAKTIETDRVTIATL